jgi:hypothetical protein
MRGSHVGATWEEGSDWIFGNALVGDGFFCSEECMGSAGIGNERIIG